MRKNAARIKAGPGWQQRIAVGCLAPVAAHGTVPPTPGRTMTERIIQKTSRATYGASLAAFAATLAGFTAAHAQEAATAFVGAEIRPVSGDPIAEGVLLVEGGKVTAIGPQGEVEVPEDAVVISVKDRVIIPGLVDTHSHLGLSTRPQVRANSDTNESTNPVTPELRALDAINPADPGIRMALSGGVTTANIMPGSGNVIGGQTAYVKYRGATIEDMLIDGAIGGLKMANGENPKRNYGSRNQAPLTRMAVAALARKAYIEAQGYAEDKAAHDTPAEAPPPPTPPVPDEEGQMPADGTAGTAAPAAPEKKPPFEVDLGKEALLEVLSGDRIVQHHTHRADDILTVLRLAEEFGFRVVIQHGSEAWKVADELAEAEVPVSFIVIDAPGGKHEAAELSLRGAGILEKAGVKVALHTDDPIIGSRFFLRTGALSIREGMTEEGALRALTLNGAEMLDLGDRVGSLEPGKDADFVILDGAPFALRTKVLETWIEGEKVFDRSNPDHRLYATGGFAIPGRYPSPPAEEGEGE